MDAHHVQTQRTVLRVMRSFGQFVFGLAFDCGHNEQDEEDMDDTIVLDDDDMEE